jgi:hypothetical protein
MEERVGFFCFIDMHKEKIPGGPMGHRMHPDSMPSNNAITPAAPGSPGAPGSPESVYDVNF